MGTQDNKAGTTSAVSNVVTATNEKLLADMLGEKDSADAAEFRNSHSVRIRREVHCHRTKDEGDLIRPGSSRDIGGETRIRAQQLIDAERQRTRGDRYVVLVVHRCIEVWLQAASQLSYRCHCLLTEDS